MRRSCLIGETTPAASVSSPRCPRRRQPASVLLKDAARAVGGGGGGKGDIATAGGKDPSGHPRRRCRLAAEAIADLSRERVPGVRALGVDLGSKRIGIAGQRSVGHDCVGAHHGAPVEVAPSRPCRDRRTCAGRGVRSGRGRLAAVARREHGPAARLPRRRPRRWLASSACPLRCTTSGSPP